jgi:hypothetical protein
MPIDPQEFARMLGAEIVGDVPDVGGGPFGMARLAQIMHKCLTPSQGERPGRPTNPNWIARCKVPMSDATLNRLTQLATDMSTMERRVSPMQVAAQLLEEAVGRVGVREDGTMASAASGELWRKLIAEGIINEKGKVLVRMPEAPAKKKLAKPTKSANGQEEHA